MENGEKRWVRKKKKWRRDRSGKKPNKRNRD